uniref:HTH psq-type domain-containing protein n=1 Tax=Amphimedon queenslandica TaxID=400682 RepID=A0A1X7T0B7_AMPQE
MATATRGKWKAEDLEKAIKEVRNGRLSVREAAIKYSIPKSTIHDHSSSKVKQISARPDPSPILMIQEERELVDWIIHMAEIGYGQCRQQVTTMVSRILDKYKRPNPFPNNIPGKDWWHLGIYPPNQLAIDQQKLQPAKVYEPIEKKEIKSSYLPIANQMALQSLEEELDEEILKKYQSRLEESYDLIEDPLYRAWKKLKCKTKASLRVPLQDLTN